MFNRIGQFICSKFHVEIYRPVNGWYTCRRCLRRYPVPWPEPGNQNVVVPITATISRQIKEYPLAAN